MAAVIKAGTKAYRDQLRAQLVELGFIGNQLTEHLATDLITKCGKRPREAWRLANELSLDEVAVRGNTVLADTRAPLRKNRIWEYEQWPRGGQRPTVPTLRMLAQVLGTSWDRLVDVEDLHAMADADRDDYHGAVRQRARSIPDVHAAAQRPDTRTSAVPGEAVIDEAADESAQLAAWAASSNIDDDGVAYFHREIRAIAHSYVFSAPLPLFRRARKVRSRVSRLLQGHQHPNHTRDLWLVGAQACTLMAWMSGDLGNYAAAGDHGWAAWTCAEHAENNSARAWVRATQSKLAFWDGDYVESGRLAAGGLEYATGDSAGLLLALLEARAWARLGRVGDATAALTTWQRLSEQAHGESVGGVLGLSPAQEHYLAGSTYLWLRKPADALAETTLSLELFEQAPPEQRFYGAEMLARVDAGRACLAAGGDKGLEAAEAHLDPVLAVDPEQRLETFIQNLTHVGTQLAAPKYRGNQRAQDLQERLLEYRQDSVSRTLDLRP
jgi:transcriptional regulator with XRE-family HTH domain